MVDWLRWWHGTVSDTKFMWVARRAGARHGDVIAVWAALLEMASQSAHRGDVSRFDADAFDCLLTAEEGTTASIVEAMEAKKLIVAGRLTGWETRQPNREDSGSASALSSTERSRLHRANKRIAELEQRLLASCVQEKAISHGNAVEHMATPRVDKNRLDKSLCVEGSAVVNEKNVCLESRGNGIALRQSAPDAGRTEDTAGEGETSTARREHLCHLLGEAGIADAASHHLAQETWDIILGLRRDEEILAFARSKLMTRPGRRTSLRYLAPGLLEAPSPFVDTASPHGKKPPRLFMNARDAGRLAAARSIFGIDIELQHDKNTIEHAPDPSPATAGKMGTKTLC